MTVEGNDGSYGGRADLRRSHIPWKVVAAAAVGFGAAWFGSNWTESNGSTLPLGLNGEYLELNECLEAKVASDGLYAICSARDGSSWRVTQSNATVFVPENAVSDNLETVGRISSDAEKQYSSLSFITPLLIAPETAQDCEASCTIAAKDAEGNWAYYAPTAPHVISGLSQSIRLTQIDGSIAVLTDNSPQD